MTPKEKAQELFDKFFKYAGDVYLSKNDVKLTSYNSLFITITVEG